MTRPPKRLWLAAALLALASITTVAYADDYSDVAKLVQTGQYPDAMAKADAFLAQHPKDAHMRFIKGLILAEQNKTAEAITIFIKMTEDFPDLPEPYNNLAVLYASQNQFDKARAALEMAIRTNPSYSTAHENLGDVYAKMASQAYDKALQLDSGNAAAKLKLSLIRNLFSGGPTSSATATTASSKVAAPSKPVVAAVTPSPTPKVVAPAVKTETLAKPAEAVKALPAKAEPTKVVATKPAATTNTDQDDVMKVVDAWANAWSNKNTAAYLAFYGNDFQTPKGESRKAWSDERRLRIESKGHIQVKVEAPKITIDGNTAMVHFRQIYNSDHLKADSRKTLVLSRQDGKWLITQEHSGS